MTRVKSSRELADEKRLRKFLDDLQKVYEKHKLVVTACGCCQSPWVTTSSWYNIQRAIVHLRREGLARV